MSGDKLHWYCFSYYGNSRDGKLTEFAHGSAYAGYKTKKITLSRIEENKAFARVSDSSVLISCSYLGLMTNEEFTGNKDEENESEGI